MLLLAKDFKKDFDGLSEDDLAPMPDHLRAVAELILDWKKGKQEFVLYTSGSTGKPKPIHLQRDKIIYSANLTAKTFGLQAGDTLLCCLGVNYVAGFMMVMRALVLNCNLYVTPARGNPLQDIDLENTKLDFAAFVPLQLDAIYNNGEKYFLALDKMKAIIVGGAAVSPVLEEKLQVLQVPVYHTYSMTETYTHVAIRRLNGKHKSDSYFPLPEVELNQDERGCLVVKSTITDNKPLATNDLVEFQQDGSFKLLGRIDNVINSGGIKIQAEEVENAAKNTLQEMKLPDYELFAFGLPDEKHGQKMVLFVESEAWENEIQVMFLDKLRNLLTPYKAPKKLIFIKPFARTQTGKTDRQRTADLI